MSGGCLLGHSPNCSWLRRSKSLMVLLSRASIREFVQVLGAFTKSLPHLGGLFRNDWVFLGSCLFLLQKFRDTYEPLQGYFETSLLAWTEEA